MTGTNGSKVRRIVVGVDGSPPADAALRWAIREAKLTGDVVRAVAAWQYPIAAGGYGWGPMVMTDDLDLETVAKQALNDAIERARPEGSAVTIEQQVTEGYAPSVLMEASKDADLLVVGSRGHGTFTDAMLGSVSQHCAHHAKCPVVIVRSGTPRPGKD
jgi:nucleotide-binding universal stress UspA family protein